MKAALQQFSISLILTGLLMMSARGFAHAGERIEPEQDRTQAVDLYRQGKYLAAEQALSDLYRQHPEDSIAAYYLAMTQAQLGRFERARELYNAVLLLDPYSKAAALAKEGLKYLPEVTADNLDLPPRFNQMVQGMTQTPAQPQVAAQAAQTGMTPQDMMLMQMMMGQNGNNGGGMGGGFNPMMFGLMNQQPADPNTLEGGGMFGNMDPSVMSTMLMNQMLQNFNMMGDDSNKN